jgi:hypothetical protein
LLRNGFDEQEVEDLEGMILLEDIKGDPAAKCIYSKMTRVKSPSMEAASYPRASTSSLTTLWMT